MKRKLINYLGLLGIVSLISYALAVFLSPLAYPGYDWMSQAVSDLSADNAPSLTLWTQLSAPYGTCGIISIACVAIYVSENKISTKLFRIGIYLFAIMNLVSNIGYKAFPLSDSGKEIASFQEIMHIVVTAMVVLLSIVSLVLLIIAGAKNKEVRGIGIWAVIALLMMFIGSIGTAIVPTEYFGIVERFSVFAAVGYNAVLGVYLFNRFNSTSQVPYRSS